MKKISIIFMIGMLSVACEEEFLDQAQDKNTSVIIETVDQIDRLFNYHGVKQQVWDYVNVWSHDNASMPQEILDETATFRDEERSHYTFAPTVNRANDIFWTHHYRKISTPNKVQELLEQGLLIGDDQDQIASLIAEAHYWRAATFFDVLVVYGLYPSVANEDEMGIVLKKASSFAESEERASLKESVEGIIVELEEALKYPDNYVNPNPWRVGKPGVHALAARFYLYIGDYDNAKFHSNAALTGQSTITNYEDRLTTSPFTKWWGDFVYPNTTDFNSTDPADWIDFYNQYSYQIASNAAWNTSPSQELLDLYDPADLRNLFYIKDWFQRSGANTNKWYTYMNLSVGQTLAREGVPEMYLTRAECKAREGDFAGAMADVEMLRVKRFKAADYSALPIPTSIKEAVNVIIDERRREDPFEYRLMDIKRLNNDPITDPIIITRVINGETIVIQPDNRGYARPIGDEIINLSDGQTKQNEY